MAGEFDRELKKGKSAIASATGVAKAAFPKLSLAAKAAKGPVKEAMRKRINKRADRHYENLKGGK
jgi:hypothetical protein